MRTDKKQKLHKLRQWRIRKKIAGTADRPRMSVCFTGEHIYVQFIDDVAGKTLASASTRAKTTPDREKLAANVSSAKVIGKIAAEAAKAKGISQVVFDRAGERYHWSAGKDGKPVYGKVAALAQAAREAGLKF
jgi:large subunit ribosomal protein L18